MIVERCEIENYYEPSGPVGRRYYKTLETV